MHSEGLNQHPVWKALNEAQQKLIRLGENVLGTETGPATDILRSITVAETLKSVPPIYIDKEKLDQLQTTAESVSQAVVDSLENQTDATQELESHSRNIATLLLSLPVDMHTESGLEEYEQSLQKFTSNLASITDQLVAKNKAADELLEEYEGRVNEKQEQIDEQFQKRQEQLDNKLTELQSSVDEIKGTIEAQKTRLDEALNSFSKTTASQTQEVDEKHKELRQQFELRFKHQEQWFHDQANSIVGELTEYEDQASRLVESTAHGAITTEYGARAAKERKSALVWSISAVLLAVGGLLMLAVGMNNLESMDVSESIWKSSVTIVLLAVAGYMGREAGAHRREERDAKRTQLDLNAFHPFLSLMKEEDATELRKEFAQRVFSRPLANEKNHGGFSLFRISPKKEEESPQGPQEQNL